MFLCTASAKIVSWRPEEPVQVRLCYATCASWLAFSLVGASHYLHQLSFFHALRLNVDHTLPMYFVEMNWNHLVASIVGYGWFSSLRGLIFYCNFAGSLTLSYSSKINSYLYHQRVSPPLKKFPDMLSEGNAAHPVGCDSPLQIVMAVWRPFCLNSNFPGWVWRPLLTIMMHQKALLSAKGWHTRPNKSAE